MLIDRPTATVSGPLAVLLVQLVNAPAVRPLVTALPAWARPYRGEIAAGLDAVARAAEAWSATAPEREDATTPSAAASGSECSIADAAALLGLSVRRTQELAAAGELGGRRIGRAWLLDRHVIEQVSAERRRWPA